jgi:hypothetical protein
MRVDNGLALAPLDWGLGVLWYMASRLSMPVSPASSPSCCSQRVPLDHRGK